MTLFRPLIRYADFKGRASRREYWGFAFVQGFWYALLFVLMTVSMGQGDAGRADAGVLSALTVIGLSVLALVIPNYAVLTRRLHDSGRGAVWLLLMAPGVASAVMMVGTVVAAFGSVGLGAGREAFLGLALSGLGAAGLLGLISMLCQMILFVMTLLPGTPGDNAHGPDPRNGPGAGWSGGGSSIDEARLDALFAEAKRESRREGGAGGGSGGRSGDGYRPVFDFTSDAPVAHPASRAEAPPAAPAATAFAPSPAAMRTTPAFGRRGA